MSPVPKPHEAKPRTEKEHEFCNDMGCPICTHRCYDSILGHVFHNGQYQPCDCGKYKTLKDADREWVR